MHKIKQQNYSVVVTLVLNFIFGLLLHIEFNMKNQKKSNAECLLIIIIID